MKKTLLVTMIVIGIVTTIVISNFIIDALTPTKSLAFTYRLVANICTVVIFAIIYWWRK